MPIYLIMIRAAAIAMLLFFGLIPAAFAQTTVPPATPTNGAVGSAALRNGFPISGGAVALPSIAPSSTTTTTPAIATTTSATTAFPTPASTAAVTPKGTANGANAANNSAGSGLSAGSGSGFSGGAGNTSPGARAVGAGSASTTGAATAIATGTAGNLVLCPPSDAPGIAPLFTGTDLSCAPQ